MNFNAYNIITRAVEEGVALGTNRAFKHSDAPDIDTIREHVVDQILNQLSRVIEWEYPA